MATGIKYIEHSYHVITPIKNGVGEKMLKKIEDIARIYYNMRTNNDPIDKRFIRRILREGNLSLFDHDTISVSIEASVIVTMQIMGCRLATTQVSIQSFSPHKKLEVIRGGCWDTSYAEMLDLAYRDAASRFLDLTNRGMPIEHAIQVLPMSTAIKTIITASLRGWMCLFYEARRMTHPDVLPLMEEIRQDIGANIPVIYDDKSIMHWR